MMRGFFVKKMPLHEWKLYTPKFLILVQIIRTTACTSGFSKRMFSLACCLKTWLRLSMHYALFDSLDLIVWYKDNLDKKMA